MTLDILSAGNSKKYIKEATEWFFEKNWKRRKGFRIIIKLGELSGHLGGVSMPYDRWFAMDIEKRLVGYEKIGCLFHELIHIDQFLKGDLVDVDGKLFYKGKNYRLYHKNPSEIDAFGRGSLWYDKWLEETGYYKKAYFTRKIFL